MRTLKALGGAVLMLMLGAPAYAQFGDEIVFDPTMYAAQLQQLAAEQATASTVAQQLQIDIANDTGGNAGAWINNSAYLASLPQLIDLQQGLAYDNQALAQQFALMYPGLPQPGAGPAQASQLTSYDTALNTLNGALQGVQSQANDFQAENVTFGLLDAGNQSAIGNLQAIQTGNEIALQLGQQLQMLRQLVMLLINSENLQTANQTNSQTQSQMAAEAMNASPAQVTVGAPLDQPSTGETLPLLGSGGLDGFQPAQQE
jgi:P-type conjugative transfer protein TrbJ